MNLRKKIGFGAAIIGLFSITSSASASGSCSAYFYSSYDYCVTTGYCSPYASAAEWVAAHPQCFGGSSTTSQAQISGSSFTQINSISSALSGRFGGGNGPAPKTASTGSQGMAAGNGNNWSVWGNVATNDTRQSYTVAARAVSNNTDILNSVIGADYTLAPNFVLGVSGAFDRGDSSTQAGATSVSKGYSIAPYLGYQLTKEFSLDASVGFGAGKLNMAGSTEAESDRLFYAANLSYNRWVDNIQLTGKLGYLHGEEKYGNTKTNGVTNLNTAAKNKMDRWQLGAQAGYWMSNGVMPYASLAYLTDRRSTSLVGGANDPIGKSAWQWSLGVNFFSLGSGITGGIAYLQEEGRSNQKNDSLMANINYRF